MLVAELKDIALLAEGPDLGDPFGFGSLPQEEQILFGQLVESAFIHHGGKQEGAASSATVIIRTDAGHIVQLAQTFATARTALDAALGESNAWFSKAEY